MEVNVKKAIFLLLFFILFSFGVFSSSDYLIYPTFSVLDHRYCLVGGSCNLTYLYTTNITTTNITVIDRLFDGINYYTLAMLNATSPLPSGLAYMNITNGGNFTADTLILKNTTGTPKLNIYLDENNTIIFDLMP